MNKFFGLLLLALAFLAPQSAFAVTCFWVGGTATWDGTNTGGGGAGGIKWASASGGGTACAGGGTGGSPSTGDSATFDGSSGGGTVTVGSAISGTTIVDITSGAFTGTLDFSANNTSMTISGVFNAAGSGVRKYLMGSGTFTFTGTGGQLWNLSGANIDGTSSFAANYTFSATSSGQRTFNTIDGKTYGTLTIATNSSRGIVLVVGSSTFSSLSLAAGSSVQFQVNKTTTLSSAPTWTGTSSNPIFFYSDYNGSGATPVLSVASGTVTCDWCAINSNAASGGATFNATNSLNLGRNTGWTITAPSAGGGGGRIIGG